MGHHAGAPIVLTAPLTESIDHAGFFIQMSLASIPGQIDCDVPLTEATWRSVPTTAAGRAGTAPAGLRVLEAVPPRHCVTARTAPSHPDAPPEFIGERTRAVA